MHTTTQAATSKKRVEWVDYAKGIAIFMVVLLHQFERVINGDYLTDPGIIALHESWEFYSFNMAIFFMISGLFIVRSLRRTLNEFTLDKVRTLVYPYIVWSILSVTAVLIIPGTESFGYSLSTYWQLIYEPVMQLWFLHSIFIVIMLFAFMFKVGINKWWFLGLSVGVMALHIIIDTSGMGTFVEMTPRFMLFFAIGALFGPRILEITANARMNQLLGVAAASFVIWVGAILIGQTEGTFFTHNEWIRPFIVALGAIAVVSICVVLERVNALRMIHFLGDNSLYIFLMHLVGLGFREALDRGLGIESAPLHLIGGLLVTLYVPIIAKIIIEDKIGFKYAFTWPKPQTKTPSMTNKPGEVPATT